MRNSCLCGRKDYNNLAKKMYGLIPLRVFSVPSLKLELYSPERYRNSHIRRKEAKLCFHVCVFNRIGCCSQCSVFNAV